MSVTADGVAAFALAVGAVLAIPCVVLRVMVELGGDPRVDWTREREVTTAGTVLAATLIAAGFLWLAL